MEWGFGCRFWVHVCRQLTPQNHPLDLQRAFSEFQNRREKMEEARGSKVMAWSVQSKVPTGPRWVQKNRQQSGFEKVYLPDPTF